MKWEDVLNYKEEVEYMCNKWCNVYDSSMVEDAIQHTYIKMYETVDVTEAEHERNFVLGAITRILHNFFRSASDGRWTHISLDQLSDAGVQIDTDGDPIWPTTADQYKGEMK
jgi:hypothetical protein